jgi:hypothetical protein
MDALVVLILFVAGLIVFDVVALRFGAESRHAFLHPEQSDRPGAWW